MKSNYILSENLTGTIAVYLILKKLMLPWEEWDAYKLKIIDKDGKKIKHPATSKEREAWDMLTRLCWNIKKITTKFVGKSKFAQYFSCAYLLKDSLNYYIELNQERLNETLLSDMTFKKQSLMNNLIKNVSEGTSVQTMVNEPDCVLEYHICKIEPLINKVLKEHNEAVALFEDGTVAGDIAQVVLPLGGSKKPIDPLKIVKPAMRKLKQKRKPKNESN